MSRVGGTTFSATSVLVSLACHHVGIDVTPSIEVQVQRNALAVMDLQVVRGGPEGP